MKRAQEKQNEQTSHSSRLKSQLKPESRPSKLLVCSHESHLCKIPSENWTRCSQIWIWAQAQNPWAILQAASGKQVSQSIEFAAEQSGCSK